MDWLINRVKRKSATPVSVEEITTSLYGAGFLPLQSSDGYDVFTNNRINAAIIAFRKSDKSPDSISEVVTEEFMSQQDLLNLHNIRTHVTFARAGAAAVIGLTYLAVIEACLLKFPTIIPTGITAAVSLLPVAIVELYFMGKGANVGHAVYSHFSHKNIMINPTAIRGLLAERMQHE